MKTFTTVTEEQAAQLLYMYGYESVTDFRAAAQGSENSTYLMTASRQQRPQPLVVTLFESLQFDDLTFFQQLLDALAKAGLPVAPPQRNLDGMPTTLFRNRPAWVTQLLPGHHRMQPGPDECRAVGDVLARLHGTTSSLTLRREPVRNLHWYATARTHLSADLDAAEVVLLTQIQAARQRLEAADELPQAVIHADLFRDNVLFDGQTLTGVIDFYHAVHEPLILDLAIALNDWCGADSGTIDADCYEAMLSGYTRRRPLTPLERTMLPTALVVGAGAFWTSRMLVPRSSPRRKDATPLRQLTEYQLGQAQAASR